ncbi:SGNH/GDSL hydrolase family protein [Allorhizobium sp. BGMRC 0089]|uniref:SGNH/GDSL hydrolase family protein n=1 Tax=Allorhizobium sonneratiae TaxID=2934936 RepID=UPI00203477E5|nr:SGNH/GDSL hydrolase family protein [Allorhizobium sonneratiae]MCM2294387.1 SGNH/GDSL hydrolase family protein [Allorhizobium sonneratiae]
MKNVTTWHIVGDSHIQAFRAASEMGLMTNPCLFTEVPAATAVGLRNPNSLTDAVSIFKKELLTAKIAVRPVIQLGEVDCGFVIWYRAQKHNESIQSQFDQSIAAYFDFVDEIRNGGYMTVVISAATIPTIRDGQDWGDVANARRQVRASLRERTDLTLDYNAKLREEAGKRSLPFIDITDKIINSHTRVIDDNFRHPDPTDHHLDPKKAGPLWAEELNRIDRSYC